MKMIQISKKNSHAPTAHLELQGNKYNKTMSAYQVLQLIAQKIRLLTKKRIIIIMILWITILSMHTFLTCKMILDCTVFKKNLKAIFFHVVIVYHHKKDKSLKIISTVIQEQPKVALKLSRNQIEPLGLLNLMMIVMAIKKNKENSNSQLM